MDFHRAEHFRQYRDLQVEHWTGVVATSEQIRQSRSLSWAYGMGGSKS